jgi:transposase
LLQQRRVFVLRTTQALTWVDIAKQVKNLQGQRPYWKVCRDTHLRLSSQRRHVKLKYKNCGRKPKLTKELRSWVVRRMLALRHTTICTSSMLQRDLAREKGVTVEASSIRRVLASVGYRWLPRTQKSKHDAAQRAERLAFAQEITEMTVQQLEKKLNFAMDGIVLSVPPKDPPTRDSYCRLGDTHLWRKPCEGNDARMCGGDKYSKQIPASRIVPLWAGISVSGSADVLWNDRRKVTSAEWAVAVTAGNLTAALRAVNPDRVRGPWNVLCDNEAFLRAGPSQEAHRACGVRLWKLPARSPDLNPVEKSWSWVRRRLRALDLADLVAKRPIVGRVAFKARVRRVLSSVRAKEVAAKCVRGLKKVAAEVVRKRGAATSG